MQSRRRSCIVFRLRRGGGFKLSLGAHVHKINSVLDIHQEPPALAMLVGVSLPARGHQGRRCKHWRQLEEIAADNLGKGLGPRPLVGACTSLARCCISDTCHYWSRFSCGFYSELLLVHYPSGSY